MHIAIASDHGGYQLKEELKKSLSAMGVSVSDLGTDSTQSVDYPDIGIDLATRVSRGEFQRGILVCGTGIGMSIVANKVRGIRAALVWDPFTARMAKEHNDANIIVLGGRTTGVEMAKEILKTWMDAKFEDDRHRKRLDKISEIERNWVIT